MPHRGNGVYSMRRHFCFSIIIIPPRKSCPAILMARTGPAVAAAINLVVTIKCAAPASRRIIYIRLPTWRTKVGELWTRSSHGSLSTMPECFSGKYACHRWVEMSFGNLKNIVQLGVFVKLSFAGSIVDIEIVSRLKLDKYECVNGSYVVLCSV